MKKEENGTKLCKHCKTEIPAGAKVCPNCRKKQGMSGCLIVIIVFVVLIAFLMAIGGGSGSTTEDDNTVIEYTSYTVDEMMNDVDNNAMAASDKYKDQYVEISGRLAVIDSDGKYISVLPENDSWAIVGVSCYIKSDEQRDIVKTLSIGDSIVVKGKITSVGEVLGYNLEIDSIN